MTMRDTLTVTAQKDRVEPIALDSYRLEKMAKANYYNPYTLFEWPDSLPVDQPWMSEDLTTLYGTQFWDELTRDQQLALTRYEAVNFFSLNIHGIRELMGEVILRIHTKPYANVSEFLHHFIGEENEHMWFFSKFCWKYGGKIYPPQPKLLTSTELQVGAAAKELIIFARILIFEEIVDFFNSRMATDDALPDVAREINEVHHQDESRHVAFGRQIFSELRNQVMADNPDDVPTISQYLMDYLEYSVRSLYNPAVYRDVGIPNAIGVRSKVLQMPERVSSHDAMLLRTRRFLSKSGLLASS